MITYEVSSYERELLQVLAYFREAADELKVKNRFANEKLDRVVNALVYADMNAEIIRKGTILYRARNYTELDAAKRFLYCDREVFQGYDKDGSFVNPKADKEGRCNPQYIPYLYVAESRGCCIAEISPRVGEYVSVAEIKVNKPIKILSLAKQSAVSKGEPSIISGIPDSTIILYLEGLFSKRHEKDGDYLMTQYLSEKVKNAGYDGISFFSSVYTGTDRTNITIFNYHTCEAINSKLCKISDIAIEYTFDSERYREAQTDWTSADAYEAFLHNFL